MTVLNGPSRMKCKRPLSEDVFSQIIAGAEGTPLRRLLDCVARGWSSITIGIFSMQFAAGAVRSRASSQDPAAFEAAARAITSFFLNGLRPMIYRRPGPLTWAVDWLIALTWRRDTGTNPLGSTPLEPSGKGLLGASARTVSQRAAHRAAVRMQTCTTLLCLTRPAGRRFQGGRCITAPEVTISFSIPGGGIYDPEHLHSTTSIHDCCGLAV